MDASLCEELDGAQRLSHGCSPRPSVKGVRQHVSFHQSFDPEGSGREHLAHGPPVVSMTGWGFDPTSNNYGTLIFQFARQARGSNGNLSLTGCHWPCLGKQSGARREKPLLVLAAEGQYPLGGGDRLDFPSPRAWSGCEACGGPSLRLDLM